MIRRGLLQRRLVPGLRVHAEFRGHRGKRLGVSSDPELLTYQLDKNSRCLVMASDGVFEFMTNEEVMAAAKRHWGTPWRRARRSVATAYDYWATEDSRSDDVTARWSFSPPSGAADGADLDDLGFVEDQRGKGQLAETPRRPARGRIKNRPASGSRTRCSRRWRSTCGTGAGRSRWRSSSRGSTLSRWVWRSG